MNEKKENKNKKKGIVALSFTLGHLHQALECHFGAWKFVCNPASCYGILGANRRGFSSASVYIGDPDCILGSWLQRDPVLVIQNQWIEDLPVSLP